MVARPPGRYRRPNRSEPRCHSGEPCSRRGAGASQLDPDSLLARNPLPQLIRVEEAGVGVRGLRFASRVPWLTVGCSHATDSRLEVTEFGGRYV